MEQDVKENEVLLLRFKYHSFFDLNPKVCTTNSITYRHLEHLLRLTTASTDLVMTHVYQSVHSLIGCLVASTVWCHPSEPALWTGQVGHPAGGNWVHRGGNDDVCCPAGKKMLRVCVLCLILILLFQHCFVFFLQHLQLEDPHFSFHWAMGTFPSWPQANKLDGLPAQSWAIWQPVVLQRCRLKLGYCALLQNELMGALSLSFPLGVSPRFDIDQYTFLIYGQYKKRESLGF